jgi:hypothetical protein
MQLKVERAQNNRMMYGENPDSKKRLQKQDKTETD